MHDFFLAASAASESHILATPDLHRWSIENPQQFWSLVWDFFEVVGDKAGPAYLPSVLPDAHFFPDATLNVAENLLAPWRDSDAPAVIAMGEGRGEVTQREVISGRELNRRVGSVAEVLRERGVGAGDRVGVIMPVTPEALVATLAALAVGAVVSSVSPEFGATAIVDRLGQLEPKVLFTSSRYQWNGKDFDRSGNIAHVLDSLVTVETVITTDDVTGESLSLATAMQRDVTPVFDRLPFNHPAYILFSSGTTGKPKCLIHRAGGVLLKHLVEEGLHADIKKGDRLLFYTTTSWMMWNWEISALALGAALILHDGAPAYPRSTSLFQSAADAGATHVGVGAGLIDHIKTEGDHLADIAARMPLRSVLVTGSPLSVAAAAWLAGELGPEIMINPISGGTDLVGVFVGGDPTREFFAGEMTGPALGTAVDVFNDSGVSAADAEPGELVCTAPFPTVPLGIWGDHSGERLRETYFDVWPGIWVHGDRAVRSSRGGIAILGRSDATLNVGGVRIGTAEIYSALAAHDVVKESLAFGQEKDGDTRIVLLVVPFTQGSINEKVSGDISSLIRQKCSPRHVPSVILEVPEIPTTHTGKISEIAVREAVHGREVKGRGALANPECLESIAALVRALDTDPL